MSLQPFQDEQLNYFKFASIVLNEFPKALRHSFKSMWDNNYGHLPGFQPWDDSIAVRNLFLTTEGGTTKVPTNSSYEEWDCTALFQATIYARSFALPDSKGRHRTLSDLYVKPHKLAHGKFHASLTSPGGNRAETFALAIDQLRLLRNSLCHSSSSEIGKPTFDQFMQHAKDAFKALGVKADPIDVIGGLTESGFPTKEVRRLEQAMKDDTQAYVAFLEGTLERKIDDLTAKVSLTRDEPDTKPSLPKSCLPSMVPHFTGRLKECEEITGHLTSGSARIMSIWGSPGFGKTSVAIAVGHHLDSQGLPVYFLSLRGLQSKADLVLKLLSFFRRPATNGKQQQRLSLDDELFQLFNKISDSFVLILDNADELLESGMAKVKEDFTHFLEEVLRRTEKVAIVITTRESLEFMNMQFQGHEAVRICPLHELSSRNLVNELLPNSTASDCARIQQICGHVPLAMKLLCSNISEDDVDERSQVLDDFTRYSESNDIVEMLDNPDYPSDLRMKLLFDSSFQRLSAQEKEAFVSLSVLPDTFDLKVAAALLDVSQIYAAKKMLQTLRRKSYLDSDSKSGLFTIHKLLQSFARERGEHEMKETILDAKSRLRSFYITRFEELNEQFLTGNSMSAFVDFYENEQNFLTSLIDGCSDSDTSEKALNALVKAEMFLDSLFWCEGDKINKVYDSAIEAARNHGNDLIYRQLLVSLAFIEVTWGSHGRTMQLLSKGKYEASAPSVPFDDKGKHLCYSGIYQLVIGKTEEGVQLLEEALSFMDGRPDPEQRILRISMLQILALYYRFNNNWSRKSFFHSKALEECRAVGDTNLLIIPATENTDSENGQGETILSNTEKLINVPIALQVLCLVSKATEHLSDADTKQSLRSTMLNMAKAFEKPLLHSSIGLFNFQRNVNRMLNSVSSKPVDAAKLSAKRIMYIEKAIEQYKSTKEIFRINEQASTTNLSIHREALAKSLDDYAMFQNQMQNYSEALLSTQRALNINLKLFGREHSSTATSYHSLGVTQHKQGDFSSSLQSEQQALDIRLKLFGEEHPRTADSYHSLGVTQHKQGDYSAALQSKQRALDISRKLFGEKHLRTVDKYHSLGVTQHEKGDLSSALQSKERALDISLKLFGEQHSGTADIYHSLGATQLAQGEYSSAHQSAMRALDIRLQLFGEEHSSAADSYHLLGVTQHKQGDYSTALQSKQRVLDIRLKLFGEEHSSTADSYHSLGVTQHKQAHYSSALQSKQRALDISLKLFGERHPGTADKYHSLGVTQNEQGDLSSALQSKQRALDISLKLFGEHHSGTADIYHSLGATQLAQGDYSSAHKSTIRAFDIRLKLFGEEHSSTADSYHLLGVTQHKQGDYSSALQSIQRALDIRLELFGEEHSNTADSYHLLGVTQHEQGDCSSALKSKQRVLDIRLKLFGEEHSSTADSYHSLGNTQHKQGDYSSAVKSKQRVLDIRLKLFGEYHSITADSYHSLGVTQHEQGNYSSALQSRQRALDIRLKLFGEYHSITADSYHSLGATQLAQGDYFSAHQSAMRALDIRLQLFGENHSGTAASYHSLGVTQHEQGDYSSALQSTQRALDIRLKLLGEEHSSTANSYHLLGVTLHKQGEFFSALQSSQRALDIRLKLFGEEHLSTAESYLSLGVTQLAQGAYFSALQSTQRALVISLKLAWRRTPSHSCLVM